MTNDDKTRHPPMRSDGKPWTDRHQRAAGLRARGLGWEAVAAEVCVKQTTARNWALIGGWDALVAHARAALVRGEIEQLGAKGQPVLERLMELAEVGAATRVTLDACLQQNEIEPGEWALRVSQMLRAEREALRDWLDISGFVKLRHAQADAFAQEEPTRDEAAPLALDPDEELERAVQIGQTLLALGLTSGAADPADDAEADPLHPASPAPATGRVPAGSAQGDAVRRGGGRG
jgi:hypothetical protein